MRCFWLVTAAALLALVLGCGGGDKPEYVEVPSGDPMPADGGEGTPIQDAEPGAGESCSAPPPAGYPAMPVSDPEDSQPEKTQGGYDWVPLQEGPTAKSGSAAPDLLVMLLPLGLALARRRR